MIRLSSTNSRFLVITTMIGDDEVALDAKAVELGFKIKMRIKNLPFYKLMGDDKKKAVNDGIIEATESELELIKSTYT